MSGPLPKEAPVLPPLPESVNETFKILENNPVVKDALKQIKEEAAHHGRPDRPDRDRSSSFP